MMMVMMVMMAMMMTRNCFYVDPTISRYNCINPFLLCCIYTYIHNINYILSYLYACTTVLINAAEPDLLLYKLYVCVCIYRLFSFYHLKKFN